MDLDKALVSIQIETLKNREKNGCKTETCPYCHAHMYTINPDKKGKYCVNCGSEVLKVKDITNICRGEGVFALCYKGNGGIIPIVKDKWEETLDLLVDTANNVFHINVNDLDYCILHFFRDGEFITMDFKGML